MDAYIVIDEEGNEIEISHADYIKLSAADIIYRLPIEEIINEVNNECS